MKREIFILASIAFLTVLSSNAIAGTRSNPEVWDVGEPEGDNGGGSEDIISAWFWGESSDYLNCTLSVHTVPPISTNLDTIEYEVYFDTTSEQFAVVCTYEFLEGPGWNPAGFELRRVTYDENGSVSQEVSVRDIDGDTDANRDFIIYYIPKRDLNVTFASPLFNTWAAVWVTPMGSTERDISDEARNHTQPGRTYYLHGLEFNASVTVQEAKPGDTVYFSVEIVNPSEVNITLECNSTFNLNWSYALSINGDKHTDLFNFTLVSNSTALLVLEVNVPEDLSDSLFTDGLLAVTFPVKFRYSLYNSTLNVSEEIAFTLKVRKEIPEGPSNRDHEEEDQSYLLGLTRDQFILVVVILIVVIVAAVVLKIRS